MKKNGKREPSRLEVVADITRRRYAHQNSAVVHQKQELLLFEQGQAQTAIINLQAAIEAKKERLDTIGASLTGLAEVLSCRS